MGNRSGCCQRSSKASGSCSQTPELLRSPEDGRMPRPLCGNKAIQGWLASGASELLACFRVCCGTSAETCRELRNQVAFACKADTTVDDVPLPHKREKMPLARQRVDSPRSRGIRSPDAVTGASPLRLRWLPDRVEAETWEISGASFRTLSSLGILQSVRGVVQKRHGHG